MLFTGELIADVDHRCAGLQTGLPGLRLRRGEEAALDVLPLYDAHKPPIGRGHHDTLYALLSHVLPYVPEPTVRTDGRRTWLHHQFHSSLGSSAPGCPL
jgi:hypothetical protein